MFHFGRQVAAFGVRNRAVNPFFNEGNFFLNAAQKFLNVLAFGVLVRRAWVFKNGLVLHKGDDVFLFDENHRAYYRNFRARKKGYRLKSR